MSFDAQLRTESFEYDNLIAGDKPRAKAVYATLTDGEVVVRGSLLGVVTADGKLLVSLTAATDGSEVPRYIAAEAASPVGADAQILVYAAGSFNEDRVVYGTAHTAASVKAGLRDYQIYLETPVTKDPA